MHFLAEYIRVYGRFQRNARLYLVSNALSGVSVGIFLVLYNLYLVSLGYHADFIGLVLFAIAIGAGIAIFPAGLCIDRFGGKAVLIWSNLALGIIGAGQILFRQPLLLLSTSLVAGVLAAFTLVVNAPFLTANSTSNERADLFSFNIMLGLLTTVLGEVLGGVLPLWFRATSWLMAPLPSGLAWLLASQPEPRSYQFALLFAGVLAGPSLVPLFLLTVGTDVSRPRPIRRDRFLTSLDVLRTRKILYSPFVALIVIQVCIALGRGLFIPYFNIYFVEHLKASSALFGLIDGGANAMNALLTLVAPWMARRIGRIKTIAVTQLASIPLLLLIGLTGTLPLATILYPLRQGMMDMSWGIFQTFSMEVVPKQHRGVANSAYQAALPGATALTVPLGGLIIAHFGYPPVFILAALLYLLAIAVLWTRFGRDGVLSTVADSHQPDDRNE